MSLLSWLFDSAEKRAKAHDKKHGTMVELFHTYGYNDGIDGHPYENIFTPSTEPGASHSYKTGYRRGMKRLRNRRRDGHEW